MAGTPRCPKCGSSFDEGAVICPRCDFILDARFLGLPDDTDDADSFLDRTEERAIGNSEDAVALGDLEDPDVVFGELTALHSPTRAEGAGGAPGKAGTPTSRSGPVYIGKALRDLTRPQAVLARADDVEQRWAAFGAHERSVLGLVDGKTAIGVLARSSGMTTDQLRIALALLADKGAVRLVRLSDDDDSWDDPTTELSDTELELTHAAPGGRSARLVSSSDGPAAPLDEVDLAERHGDYRRAIELLRRVIDEAPGPERGVAHVHNRLGLLLATRMRDFVGASEALLRAIELDPPNAIYRNNLGKIVALANDRARYSAHEAQPAAAARDEWLARIKKALE